MRKNKNLWAPGKRWLMAAKRRCFKHDELKKLQEVRVRVRFPKHRVMMFVRHNVYTCTACSETRYRQNIEHYLLRERHVLCTLQRTGW